MDRRTSLKTMGLGLLALAPLSLFAKEKVTVWEAGTWGRPPTESEDKVEKLVARIEKCVEHTFGSWDNIVQTELHEPSKSKTIKFCLKRRYPRLHVIVSDFDNETIYKAMFILRRKHSVYYPWIHYTPKYYQIKLSNSQ